MVTSTPQGNPSSVMGGGALEAKEQVINAY